MNTFRLPFPFTARRGVVSELDARTTAPGVVPLIGRDDPSVLEPNRPGPRSPLAGPVHPYLTRALGLALDARALHQMDNVIRPAPRMEISIREQERVRGIRGVVSRLRTPPTSYDTGYNASPLGRAPGTAIARPLPNMTQPGPSGLPCVDCDR